MKHIIIALCLCIFPALNLRADTTPAEILSSDSVPIDSMQTERALRARIALRDLSRRAEQGDGEALYRLAYVHDIGYDSIPKDTVESTRLYRLSAISGYAPAQNYLGFRLIRGEGVEANPEEGLAWIEKAAAGGDAKAANNLGALLAEGKLVMPDREKALYWFGRAAEAGLPSAMAQLADMISDPEAPNSDFPLAAQLYMEAADAGLPDARIKLAAMLNRNAPTVTSAARLIKNKQLLADVYRSLADGYSLGDGLPYSYDQSLRDYYIASLLGDEISITTIDELLGVLPDALDTLDLPNIIPDVAEALSVFEEEQQ